jgi:hypothetical protein
VHKHIIALFPLGMGGSPAWPLAAKLGALSLTWLAPMVVYTRSPWASQSLESARDGSFAMEILRRTFPND